MKKFKKIVSAFVKGLIILGLLFPSAIFADGGIIIPEGDQWKPLDEESQNAFISYKDGFENLIVSVNLPKSDEGAVWIFPVPAKPEKVAIDVLKNIPNLSGEEVIEKAKQNIKDVSRGLRMTQIYPLFLERETYRYGPPTIQPLGGKMSFDENRAPEDVTIHEHLEKEGMTTEIITAKNSKALYNYLANKGPELKKGTFPMFDYYIGKDYTFICSWMTIKETAEDYYLENLTQKDVKKGEDIAAKFIAAKWMYDSSKLQIFGKATSEGKTIYAKLDKNSDETYTTSNRYCSYNGKYNDYADAWDIERKYIGDNKYQILIKGRSDEDCGKGQPQNTGWIQINPDNDWAITEINKCSISRDTQNSNGVLIDTYCRIDKKTRKIIEWQSGSGCGGCCACADGAGVDIDFIVEKVGNLEKSNLEKSEIILPSPPLPPKSAQQKQRGIFITFPTDKIYYPLYPTSIYESKKIPINIRVLDYVKPELYGTIKPYTKEIKYFWQSYGLGNEFENFYMGDNIKYTKIEINAPSKYLTEDLWMKKETPAKVILAGFFAKYPLIDYFAAAILWSVLAGIIAGRIIFKKSGKIKRYALLGLCNVFSIIGLIIGTVFTQTKKIEKEQKEKIKELKKELKEMGLKITSRDTKRKIFFVLLFSATFVILTLIRQEILVWIL